MNRFTSHIALITNGWRSAAPSRKLSLFAVAAMVAMLPLAAQSADDLKPPTGFRNWFHVNTMIIDKASPLFEALGGMHNVYVNATGLAALKKGGPYPDKSMFTTDLH